MNNNSNYSYNQRSDNSYYHQYNTRQKKIVNSWKQHNSQHNNSSYSSDNLKQGVTLEAGQTVQVAGKTLQIEFLTKPNGEKVAQLKELNTSSHNSSSSKQQQDHQHQHSDSASNFSQHVDTLSRYNGRKKFRNYYKPKHQHAYGTDDSSNQHEDDQMWIPATDSDKSHANDSFCTSEKLADARSAIPSDTS